MSPPTAERGQRAKQRKFRNDKIDNLRRLDAERAFAEEKSERIRRFVIGDLQNSLVDREDDDLAGPIGLVTDVQRLARLRIGRRIELDLEPALFDVGGERHNAVAQRADEDFFRIERANERDVDVTAAFEIFRHTNVLDAAGGVRLEPC